MMFNMVMEHNHLIQDSTLYHQVDDMILEATRLMKILKHTQKVCSFQYIWKERQTYS